MKYKIILLIILTFLFSSNLYSNQKYMGSNNWENNKFNNLTNYKISFSFNFSKKGVNFKNPTINKKTGLKTSGGIAGFFLYFFVFLPVGVVTSLVGIPLLAIGCYGYSKNNKSDMNTAFIIAGSICNGTAVGITTFPLFGVFY